MKFRLKNIGLIEDAEITLNDLTIICGQNNTGKTYITYSIYGFLSMWQELIDFDLKKEIFEELEENGFCSLDITVFQKNIQTILNDLSDRYTGMLENVFSVDAEWFKESLFEVIIDDFILDIHSEINTTLTSSKKDILQIKKEKDSNLLEISTLSTDNKRQIPHFILDQGINRALGKIYFGNYFKNPFIITSERTGISLFYKELDINKNVMVEHITKNKGKDINPFKIFEETISRYALPVKDNIDYTRDLASSISKEKSYLHSDREITKYFSDILQGSYKVVNKEVYFTTKKNKKQIPMYFASSATKSLVELFFYIKHSAKKGDLLMIDEPELNLHPDNHRKITRLLSHLSNKGIYVFITTHSDYMIKEFNNLIRLKHNIANKEKIIKKYGYKEHDNLDYAKISAYVNSSGYLSKAPIDDMGIEMDTFDKVLNDLSSSMDDIYFNIEE
ncbi:AAA family ATPase [Sulfurovum indicum]|uniref:AAA family ATPase n=2 Tax=Sulfurovum TaxID=265570 RepID=A0A7M1S190_9BACT|nr:ATP-binding protein [Sulfurovum indicum]QOR61207.1 AAA family ATPase [Sulfurovum indicum]